MQHPIMLAANGMLVGSSSKDGINIPTITFKECMCLKMLCYISFQPPIKITMTFKELGSVLHLGNVLVPTC